MDTRTVECRVLSSPELLCLIFLHLDQRTLLANAQRVCKDWHDQISSVSILQRHLFLDLPTETHSGEQGSRRMPTRNPLLSEVFAPWFNGGVADDESALSDDSEDEDKPHGIQGEKKTRRALPDYPPTELYRQLKSTGIYKLRKKKSENPFLRPGSSWMQMHITNPPATKLELHLKASHGRGDSRTVSELYYPAGIRMGQFYAITLAFTSSSRRWCDLEVKWPPENMRFHRPSESPTRQAGILRTLQYSMARWRNLQGGTREPPKPLHADVVLKTSEFFGCVIRPLLRETALHDICGRELMSQLFEDETKHALQAR